MRVGSILGSLALAILFQNGMAQAEECGPLKMVNSVDLVAGPNRALVPVSINGTPKLFLLDTGGAVSHISRDAAQELGLTLRDSGVKMLDMYGNASTKMVRLDKFTLGRLTGENIYLQIQPKPDFGKGTRYVGLLAPDLMGHYDTEIDFSAYKMNFFSADHCPGRVVYWPHAALAVVPMTFRKNHIRLPVTVDGRKMIAIIDTGATNTVMMAEAARRFDVSPETPGNVPLKNRGLEAYGRVFSTLDFDGVAVKNPHIVIVQDLIGTKDPNNSVRIDNRSKRVDDIEGRPDLLIGMNILKKLRIYIAFDEQRLYITEASTPAKLPDTGVPATTAAPAP
ncbi:MAG TPA: pepsin/retropepsin-like aspartic protease family protein [Rhizomicrobium sp.]|nr:pepsin/retropepsin-like aspartic protease family protein [Rhizomicrobium sp.]